MNHAPAQAEPSMFCIVVTYRRAAGLERVLSRVAEQDRRPDCVVVVDNESSVAVATIVEGARRLGLTIDLLDPGDNLGPAGGTAVAMSHILGRAQDIDWIVRLDDDLESLDGDVLDETMRFAVHMAESDPRVGAVGAVGARYDWKRGRLVRIRDEEIHDQPIAVDYVPTNVFPAFRITAIQDVGVFAAELFYGFSEVEFGLRLRRAGWTIYANPILWRRLGRKSALTAGPRWSLRPFNWRRFYSMRNQVHVLRTAGHPVVALRVGVVRGVLKPAAHLVIHPRSAWPHLVAGARAVRDGWHGHLGRTIEPDDF